MALISRELGGLAEGMRQGMFDAQRYNAAENAQALQREQLGELERAKGIRTQIGALDRSDPAKFAQGVYDVQAGAGDYAGAMAASGQAAALKKQAKLAQVGEFTSSLMAGDYAKAQPFVSALGMFGGKPAKVAGYDEKTNKVEFHVPGQGGKTQRQFVDMDKLAISSLMPVDAEKATELWLNMRAKAQEMASRERTAAMTRGANNRWEILQMRDASGKGRGKPTAVLRGTDDIYVKDENGRKRPATPQEIAAMGGGEEEAGPSYGPRRAALEAAFASKKFTEAENPAEAGRLRFEAVQRADTEDAISMLQGTDERTKLEFLAATGGTALTPQFLQQIGMYDPKTDRADRLTTIQNAVSGMMQRRSAIQR